VDDARVVINGPAIEEPQGHVQIKYVGDLSPHWDYDVYFGDTEVIQAFVNRVHARLSYLPWYDPQFKRNCVRSLRDAMAEQLQVEWSVPETYVADDPMNKLQKLTPKEIVEEAIEIVTAVKEDSSQTAMR